MSKLPGFKGISLPGTEHVCQDLWGSAGGTFWVIDGASRIGKKANNETTAWAKRLSRELAKAVAGDYGRSLSDILEVAISRARLERSVDHPSATIALARFNAGGAEVLVLGDCAAIVGCSRGSSVVTDQRLQNVAADVRSEREQARVGGEIDKFDHLSRVLLDKEGFWRNREGGFWVVSDDPCSAGKAITEFFPKAVSVALMTDGVFSELSGRVETEFTELARDPGRKVRSLRSQAIARDKRCDDMTALIASSAA